LLTCYETMLSTKSPEVLAELLEGDPDIDIAYEFPFSLSEHAAILARLFELFPDRYTNHRQFYLRAKTKDREIRKREKKSDEASMKKLSFLIWSILIIIWAMYGAVVIKALINKN
jgi:hypothetical protein